MTFTDTFYEAQAGAVRQALAAAQGKRFGLAETRALVRSCLRTCGSLSDCWERMRAGLQEGMEGGEFRLMCRTATRLAEAAALFSHFALEALAALAEQDRSLLVLAGEGEAEVRAALAQAEALRGKASALEEWASRPAPPVDVEKLKALAAGPFVRLPRG
jgi:hypothetical protein